MRIKAREKTQTLTMNQSNGDDFAKSLLRARAKITSHFGIKNVNLFLREP